MPPYLNKSATLSACPRPVLPSLGTGVGLQVGKEEGGDAELLRFHL